jgi:hypothetical protein
MSATAPKLGTTGWYLVGKPAGGGSCDHCGRNLKNCYIVVNPDAVHMTVGRGCVKILTGWTLTEKEAARLLFIAKRNAARAVNWATFTAEYPELAARIDADCAATAGTPNMWPHGVRADISDGDVWGGVEAFAKSYIRQADKY